MPAPRPWNAVAIRGAAVLALTLLADPVLLAKGPAELAGAVPWSYEGEQGPDQWGRISPDFAQCAQGRLQSPIDIRTAQRMAYQPLMFQYRSQPLEAMNDGRGVRLLSAPDSELHIGGRTYHLLEVRFHVPGEHQVNGVGSDAEIQFIHRDSAGQTLIVAAPVRAGRRVNGVLERILNRLPMLPGERVRHRQVGINPLFLLPSERDYFAYSGSLTTPPCREPVQWIILAYPVEVHGDQIRHLARATGNNARPVQPANDRPVSALLRR